MMARKKQTPEFRDLQRWIAQRQYELLKGAVELLKLVNSDVAQQYPREMEDILRAEPAHMLVEWASAVEERMDEVERALAGTSLLATEHLTFAPDPVRILLWVWYVENPTIPRRREELFQGSVDLPAIPQVGSTLAFCWPGSNIHVGGKVTKVTQVLDLHGDHLVPWESSPVPEVEVVLNDKGDLPWPSVALKRLLHQRAARQD